MPTIVLLTSMIDGMLEYNRVVKEGVNSTTHDMRNRVYRDNRHWGGNKCEKRIIIRRAVGNGVWRVVWGGWG